MNHQDNYRRDPLKNPGYGAHNKTYTDDRSHETPDMEMMEMQPLGVNVERERDHGMGYSTIKPV